MSSQGGVCAICLESLAPSNNNQPQQQQQQQQQTWISLGTCVPCGHCFHKKCFQRWNTASARDNNDCKCPSCNQVSEKFVELFLDLPVRPPPPVPAAALSLPKQERAMRSSKRKALECMKQQSTENSRKKKNLTITSSNNNNNNFPPAAQSADNATAFRPVEYMDKQPALKVEMREILVDWLIMIHKGFQLAPESLYLAINIVDRYLDCVPVARGRLQAVGACAMWIASKYNDYEPCCSLTYLAYLGDGAFTEQEVSSFYGNFVFRHE